MTEREVRCVYCGFPVEQCDCDARKRKKEQKINPWGESSVSSSEPILPQWEFVKVAPSAGFASTKHPDLWRLRVPGGWLYRLGKSTDGPLTFVPER